MGIFEREAKLQSALSRSKDDGSIYEMGFTSHLYDSLCEIAYVDKSDVAIRTSIILSINLLFV